MAALNADSFDSAEFKRRSNKARYYDASTCRTLDDTDAGSVRRLTAVSN